jgi:hypothetical protein
MDESHPATAAPPDDTAAPADPSPPEEKPARRRLHVPTSVLVTLLVAALSVWVAPAFTRQFEDRKQARQLQAQLAEQVALATADLGQRINSFALADLKGRGVANERHAIKDYWQVRQARIDARLRAYFSQETRTLWLRFNELVEREIELVKDAKYTEGGIPADAIRHEASYNLDELARLGRAFGVERPFSEPEIALRELLTNSSRLRVPFIRSLVVWMRGIEDKIIDRVMTEDPEAFSTTRGDLLRDLLP